MNKPQLVLSIYYYVVAKLADLERCDDCYCFGVDRLSG
jgi:hypothetical protein